METLTARSSFPFLLKSQQHHKSGCGRRYKQHKGEASQSSMEKMSLKHTVLGVGPPLNNSVISPPSGHGSPRAGLERRGGKVRLMLALFVLLARLRLFLLFQVRRANRSLQTVRRCIPCSCVGRLARSYFLCLSKQSMTEKCYLTSVKHLTS